MLAAMSSENAPDHAAELQRLNARLEQIESEAREQKREIAALQAELRRLRESGEIFEKAFRVVGFIGDYVEFGAYRGDSLIQAYFAAWRVYDELARGVWDHSFEEAEATRAGFQKAWNNMRFVTFDSFQGLPEPSPVDSVYPIFAKGTYACTEAEFRANVRKYGIEDARVIAVPGFFQDTLSPATARKLDLKRISVLHIDSDLYESAKAALQFCTPFFGDGTVVVFDEWYHFYGHPDLGEQRAFREWQQAHPEWIVTPFQKEGAFRNSFILSRPQPGSP